LAAVAAVVGAAVAAVVLAADAATVAAVLWLVFWLLLCLMVSGRSRPPNDQRLVMQDVFVRYDGTRVGRAARAFATIEFQTHAEYALSTVVVSRRCFITGLKIFCAVQQRVAIS